MCQARGVAFVLIIVGAVLSGCSARQGSIRTTPASKVGDGGPIYAVHDSKAARRRELLQDKLGLAYGQIAEHQPQKARQLAEEALMLAPKSADAYTLLAMADVMEGHVQNAGRLYRRAVDLAPNQGDYLNNYGAWLCSNGYPAEALVWFDRAIADTDFGQTAGVWANAGACALQTGALERADRDLRKALTTDPQNATALEAMAGLAFRKGLFFEARAFIERRLDAAAATPSVLKRASEIEQKLGDRAAVDRYQQQLIREFPQAVATTPKGKTS